jgi:hypothetical protein
MARVRTLKVEVLGDAASLSKMFGKAGADTDKFSEKLSTFTRKAVVPATAALAAIGTAAFKSVQDAADLEESINRISVVMGDASGEVLKFAGTAAETFGLSEKSAIDAAATFAVFGKSAGLAGSDLTDFSLDFTKLAVDLASFNNTTPEEAIQAIGAALRGEAEPLRRYGVLLDDATLRQEALALGIISSTKQALTPQQKVLAAQAAIFKQTGDAQGDFGRTSDSLVNRQKVLTARFANLRAEVGGKLIPIFEKILPVAEKILNWVSKNQELVIILTAAIAGLAAAVIVLNVALYANPFVLVVAAIAAVIAALVLAYQKVEGFRNIVDTVVGFVKTAWGFLVQYITAPIKGLIFLWEQFGGKIINVFKFVADMVKAYFNGIIGIYKNIINGVIRGLEWLLNKARGPINALIDGANLLNPFADIPKIPKVDIPELATGGIVQSATLALIGEAGPEAVVPLDRAGEFGMGAGGDTYVTINVQGGDPQAVVNALVRWSRANGSLPSAIRVS